VPTTFSIDVGQAILFNSSVSGGVPTYAYQWYLDGAPVAGATNATWNFTPSYPCNYTVYLWVTWNVSAISSPLYIVTVNPLLAASITPSNETIYLGWSQDFTSTITGGTPPIAYQWYLDGVAVAGATGSTWTFSPSSTGLYTVYVKVTDSLGQQAQSNESWLYVMSLPAGGGRGGRYYMC